MVCLAFAFGVAFVSRRASLVRPAVRQAEIHDVVARRSEVSVDVLARKFDASPETIRRDLTVLADAGLVQKIHGGARGIVPQAEGEFASRLRRNALAKRRIGEAMADLVQPHTTLFMDTGSTTLICAEALSRIKNLTIVTNSTGIAQAFYKGRGGADIYLLGGAYRGGNAQTVGGAVIRQIADYRADMAILTVGAIDGQGATDFSNHEAEVGRAMIKASSALTLVVDRSKFNRSAGFKLCGLSEIDTLVTDQAPDAALLAHLEQIRVEVCA